MLIQLCRAHNLYISNEHLGKDKFIGKNTCKNSTVIDYFPLSSNVFQLVSEFEVMNFDPMLSNVQSPIHISFCVKETENLNFSNDVSTSSNVNKNFIKWKSERNEDYVDLVPTNISNVINVLDTIKPDNVLQSDIDNLVNGFSSVLPVLDAAKDTFGIYKTRNVDGNKLSNTHKTWFSKTCENKRKKFHKARATYNKNKNYNTRRNMKIHAKEYKRTMQESYRKFNDSFANELRQMSKSDSRKFLNILNRYSESRTDSKAISIEDLYDCFKSTHSFDEIVECGENENVIFCMNDGISKELNESITDDEIRNIVKNLSNNKAGGYARIVNEYIKSTIDQCIDIYVQLFNLVFDSGFSPECWTVGIIKPLKKKQG